MKILKISALSVVLVALAVMGTAFTAKRFASDVFDYKFQFQMGDAASALDQLSNWDNSVSSLVGCEADEYLCGFDIANIPGKSVLPSPQEIVNQIRAAYVAGSNSFSHNQVIQIKDASNVHVANAVVKLQPEE